LAGNATGVHSPIILGEVRFIFCLVHPALKVGRVFRFLRKEKKMPYKSDLDEQLFSKEWEDDSGKIVVSVHSYNKGAKKLQIVREIKDREGNYTFAKLGRLSKEEIEGILPSIQEAIKSM
jgi:hypothetical protein